MKALYAGLTANVPLTAVNDYLYTCHRKPYELQYFVPITSFDDVQVYIDFGTIKPVSFTANLINLCTGSSPAITPCQYLLGIAPGGRYYGVFKFRGEIPNSGDFNNDFNSDFNIGNGTYTTTAGIIFAIAINVTMQGGSERRYFTQAYQIEACEPPLKVEACFPELSSSLGFDTNDIYYGYTLDPANSLGNAGLRYLHYAYVRQAKVYEDAPKISFTANIRQNFKTVLDRIYELRTELVPSWYKEYLLAVYARGYIQVNGEVYQVTDLAMEGIDDDDHTWKPNAKLKKETRYYFGCDNTPCDSSCCSPCGVTASVQTITDPCCTAAVISATVQEITVPCCTAEVMDAAAETITVQLPQGSIDVASYSGNGNPVTLKIVFDQPTTQNITFKWGFCFLYSGANGFTPGDQCELPGSFSDADWPTATIPAGVTHFQMDNQTAGWNANNGYVDKLYIWSVSPDATLLQGLHPLRQPPASNPLNIQFV